MRCTLEILDEPGLAGDRRHAKPAGDSRLKSRAFAAMTDAAARSFERTEGSRPGLGLVQSAWSRPTRYGRTGRNVFESHMAALSRAGPVGYCRTPTSLRPPLVATSGAMDASDLASGRLRYDDSASGRCLVAYAKSEPCCTLAGLSPVHPGG